MAPVVKALMADILSRPLVAVIGSRVAKEEPPPPSSPLRRLAIETLPKVGWPTIGMGRGDGSSNEAKSDGRYDHNHSHGSSPARNDRKWWIK